MRYEEYLAEDFRDQSTSTGVTRRQFLTAAGGILILLRWGDIQLAEAQRGGSRIPSDWNAFLRVGADGRITVFTGKVELGQGAHTALVQIAAEELNAPYEMVDIVMGDTDLCPWDAGTFGSQTIRIHSHLLRAACAEARGVLLQLAAEKWNVPAANLTVQDACVLDPKEPARRLTFAELTRGQRIERRLDPKPEPEPPAA
ncbi:MAG: molybdopterin-dependent oxidoreductase, partial [Armatimonadota bacterium]|nr:molybdopterin-dependent oxidoreductase [Armatimonadota bacterium]